MFRDTLHAQKSGAKLVKSAAILAAAIIVWLIKWKDCLVFYGNTRYESLDFFPQDSLQYNNIQDYSTI